jgi:3'-phosphoadenosine 5'-phosphosulfate sulfotransferase (PAPS reductase)/FAD synthetase
LMWEAIERFDPIAIVGLTSGGKDSTTVAHRVKDHLWQGLAYIDTGTAVPGVEEFVLRFARWLREPLRILRSGDAFREMVLGNGISPPLGFPGPAQHHRAYQRLKERQLEALRRDLKDGKRGGKVLFVTGLRRAESQRRKARAPITEVGSMGFVNPLIDWTNEDVRRYHAEHKIPESDVAALLHKSGECNCGSFASSYDGEREMLEALWPEWFENTIASLEREAEAAGIEHCRWGARNGKPTEAGIMCSDCQLKFDEPELVGGVS